MPKFNILLTSYSPDSSLSKEGNEIIAKKMAKLLKNSGKRLPIIKKSGDIKDYKFIFHKEWKPGIVGLINFLLVPKELNTKRTLKILWAAGVEIPIIDDSVFFNDKNELRKPISRLKDSLLKNFKKPHLNFFKGFKNCSVVRFYYPGKNSPKFKMEYNMLNELCSALGMTLKDDIVGDNESTKADLILIPTISSPKLRKHYSSSTVVKSAQCCSISEKYFFDCILGLEENFDTNNPQIYFIHNSSILARDITTKYLQLKNKVLMEAEVDTNSERNEEASINYITTNIMDSNLSDISDEEVLEIDEGSIDDSEDEETHNMRTAQEKQYQMKSPTQRKPESDYNIENFDDFGKRKRSDDNTIISPSKRPKFQQKDYSPDLTDISASDSDPNNTVHKVKISEKTIPNVPSEISNRKSSPNKFLLTDKIGERFSNSDDDFPILNIKKKSGMVKENVLDN